MAASLLLLLVYLNRFTHNLRPVAIADVVGRMGEDVFEHAAKTLGASAPDRGQAAERGRPVTVVRATGGGVIQAVHTAGLSAVAARHDCVISVPHVIGDYVHRGAVLVEVHGGSSPPDDRRVTGLIALGPERTIEQDPAFALRVLVDIAIRALSPAVNDPTTAVQVINHIESFLTVVGRAPFPGQYALAGEDGRQRLKLRGRAWEDYLRLAVCEIRDYGSTSVQVCRRLWALLEALLESLPPAHHPAVRAEMDLLREAVKRAFPDAARRAFAQTADSQGVGGHPHPGRSRG
ncbi:DUF2254 family protein [Streptomyces sp. NPDC001743]|uniref:DUF2254 family protein n=1 Tax=Streptomyces sp. NPDC001743 TaxID=3154397 RepID=UPI0033199297